MSAGYIQLAAGVLKIAGGVVQGLDARDAFKSEASAVEAQGRTQAEELRDQAEIMGVEGEKFKARQKMLFVKGGVSLEGSPLLILEETKRETAKQVLALNDRAAMVEAFTTDQARRLRRQGRGALLSSIGSSFGAATGNFSSFAQSRS